jgi:FAD/FMN-containing dehydrogenase
MAVINFKVIPQPPFTRTFLFSFAAIDEAIAARDAILRSPLTPAAIDLLKEEEDPHWTLGVLAGGNPAAIARYERELAAMGAQTVSSAGETAFWRRIQDYTPRYLDAHPDGAVVRVSCTLKELPSVIQAAPGPVVARAGSGVSYLYFAAASEAGTFAAGMAREHSETVIEFAPPDRKPELTLWPSPGQDLELMKRIKLMFDPQLLLNRGRLYGFI